MCDLWLLLNLNMIQIGVRFPNDYKNCAGVTGQREKRVIFKIIKLKPERKIYLRYLMLKKELCVK